MIAKAETLLRWECHLEISHSIVADPDAGACWTCWETQGSDDDNADFQVLKKSIKDSIARQQYDTFTSLISAAKAGDVEMIRDLLRCGAEIDAFDYDGRSAFAMVMTRATTLVQ